MDVRSLSLATRGALPVPRAHYPAMLSVSCGRRLVVPLPACVLAGYPLEILYRVPLDNWRGYEEAVSVDPVPIKAAITGVVSSRALMSGRSARMP